MKADSGHWVNFGEPATPAEGVALAKLRELLPDNGITHAWANLTFLSHDGRANEVDVLLLSNAGLFLIELKGWHGTISGNGSTWVHAGRQQRNPFHLTDLKAKRLSSLLKDVAGQVPGRPKIPYVQAVVVLHGENSNVQLDEYGRGGVWALDGHSVKGLGDDRLFSRFLEQGTAPAHDSIDLARSKQLRKVAELAGFVSIPKVRMAGHYALDRVDPLSEGKGWQDVLASHPTLGLKRRLRLFDIPKGTSNEKRAEIEQHAKREYLLTQGISNPGIVAPLEYLDTDSGPALVFAYDKDEVPLDEYVTVRAGELGLDERIALVRKIAEVLSFAHARNLVHRALTPKQVYVRQKGDTVTLSVRDWMTGRKHGATSTTSLTEISGGDADVAALLDEDSWRYLARETLQKDLDAPVIPLDVYGLGALAYLIFTGQPPVETVKELNDRFTDSKSFDPLAVSAELPEPFAQVVERATRFVEAERTASVDEFLDELDAAIDAVTAPDDVEVAEKPAPADPLEAVKGAFLAERFEVIERRGEGSTGTALNVLDYTTEDSSLVLKLARDDAAARRLELEAATLRGLSHPRIARLVDGPLDVDGRVGILMTDAGRETLASRLQTEGRSTIEQLERYGADLFEALQHLEKVGVFHRDIKPANLAVSPDPGSRKPRLTLFDLSLASEPLQNITSGSHPYLDPFLGQGRRQQYDRAAELYAVAVTLFEMATGSAPWWANGGASPLGAKDSVVLHAELFEASVAPTLVTFFSTALAAEASTRFGNATDMALAWGEAFAPLGAAAASDELSLVELDTRAANAALDTPLADAGLTPRALSGAGRLGAHTVGELIGQSPMAVNSIRGLGERYRKELQRRIREWNGRLRSSPAAVATVPATAVRESVERRVDRLIGRNDTEVAALHLLLGKPRAADEVVPEWPALSAIAKGVQLDPQRVYEVVESATQRWRKSGVLLPVVEDLVGIIAERGRVATLAEVAASLLLAYGSAVEGPNRLRRATGLVRAAVEMDGAAAQPRLAVQRSRSAEGAVLLAVAATEADAEVSADVLLAVARDLATIVDRTTEQHEITPANVIRASLRRAVPEGVRLSDDRLLQLAVSASSTGALSSLNELYRRDLEPSAAVKATLAGIPAAELTESSIKKRVQLRFRLVTEVPARPALDELVRVTHPHLSWQQNAYKPRDTTSSPSSTRSVTRLESTPLPELDQALRESLAKSSALTLAVHPKQYSRAAALLENRYGAQVVDVAGEFVRVLREFAAAKGAKWEVLLRADAEAADSKDFSRLSAVAKQAIAPRWREIMQTEAPLLLTNAAPLARYGSTDLLAELFDLGTPRPAARWLLVPFRSSQAAPDLDGHPVPLGTDKWLTLPSEIRELLTRTPGDAA